MGFGLDATAAEYWREHDPDGSFDVFFTGEITDGIYWFSALPDWAWTADDSDGPFNYDEENGAIYTASLKASQDDIFIGNVTTE